ncbi:hypothetical protein ACFXJJ_23620, partial [Streptomyces sp. NPDC059233]
MGPWTPRPVCGDGSVTGERLGAGVVAGADGVGVGVGVGCPDSERLGAGLGPRPSPSDPPEGFG